MTMAIAIPVPASVRAMHPLFLLVNERLHSLHSALQILDPPPPKLIQFVRHFARRPAMSRVAALRVLQEKDAGRCVRVGEARRALGPYDAL